MVRAAFQHFALVFAAGFVLGTVRVLVLVPSLGERRAELLETPVMVALSFVSAHLAVRRMRRPTLSARLGAGALALLLLLVAELALVRLVRGQTLGEYVAQRDPVSGTAYLVGLLLYAAAPSLVARGR